MSRSARYRIPVLLTVVAVLLSLAPVASAAPKDKNSPVGSADRVVMFAGDGMRPDFVEKFVGEGKMPTYEALMDSGVTGDNAIVYQPTPVFGGKAWTMPLSPVTPESMSAW